MAELQVVINPYYRSVAINGEEVIHKIIPYPDYFNSLASITCDYDEETKKITEVANVHRYVSHYVEKQYYYKHLPAYIDWYYAEKEAQKEAAEVELAKWQAIQNAITNANNTIAEYTEKIIEIKTKVETLVESISDLKSDGSDIEVTTTNTDTSRTLGDRFADTINVKDYGAVGNGIADDSEAFAAAIAAAKEKDAILYIPVGDYLIDTKPDIPAYGSGNILISDTDEKYRAFDLLAESFKLKQETWGVFLESLPEDTTELLDDLPVGAFVHVLKENGVDDETINTIVKKIGGTYNTEEIITESGEWEVPVSGWYEILAIDGGNGSQVFFSNWSVNGGYSGNYKKAFKYFEKGEVLSITIGAGGKGFMDGVTSGTGAIVDGGETTISGVTFTGGYTRISGTYSYKSTESGRAIGVGGGFGTRLGTANDPPTFYGAGGSGFLSGTSTTTSFVMDGKQGAVYLRYYDPDKDNNLEIPEGSNGYNNLLEKIETLEDIVSTSLVYNDEIIITESGEFEAPVTGYYEVICINGGNGGIARQERGTNGGASGSITYGYTYLTKHQICSVVIGNGGIGEAGVLNASSINAGGQTSFSPLISQRLMTRFAAHYGEGNLVSGYSMLRASGAGLGGGNASWTAEEENNAYWYGGGGAANAEYRNNAYILYAGNGYQGCVIVRFHNPDKKLNNNE